MELTERLLLEGPDRASGIAFDTGEAEGDRHSGLGQPKLRSGHSPDACGALRYDEAALDESSDRLHRSHAFKPDTPQELVDLDATRICPPHLVQKLCGVLYPHLLPATCNVSKHVNSPRLWPESNLARGRRGVCPREDQTDRALSLGVATSRLRTLTIESSTQASESWRSPSRG